MRLNWLKIIPILKVGACIVNQSNRIVGTGYNGMPDQTVKTSNSESQLARSPEKNNNDTEEVWNQDVKRYYG